jgi:hypothetical protein
MPEKNRFPAVLQPKPVVIDRAAFNKGQNAQYEPHIAESEVMDSLVARGPHAVGQPIPFRKSKRACSTTDNETWVEADAANTLNNFDLGDTRTTHAVVEPQVYENHPNDSRVTGPLDVAPTVVSRFGTGGGNVPLVSQEPHIVQASELRIRGKISEQQTVPTLLANTKSGDNDPLAVHPICANITGTLTVGHHSCAGHQHRMGDNSFLIGQPISFQPGNLVRKAGADPSTETFPTLTKDSGDQSPHVAYPVVPLDGMNLLLRLGPCGEEHSIQNFTPGDPSFTLKKGGNQHGVLTPMAVRRLTPVECERLQGFPDNWSRISWKGKPETECPDGPRYKACGNSMAVPVMRWIGERIAEADAKHFPPTP